MSDVFFGGGGPLDGQVAAGAAPPDVAAMGGGMGGPPSLSGSPKGEPSDNIRVAIDALTRYLEAEDEDEDIAKAMKLVTGLQDLLAKQQADADGLVQGKASPRALRRANGAAPA